jgi:predicted ATPase/DNA-binding SARP family transcriptional activator
VDGAPVASPRQRRLLAALIVAGGGVVSSDRLADVVWDGEPPDTDNALQTYVSRLRRAIGSQAIVRRPPGYALALGVDDVDAWRFETLVGRAQRLSPGEALEVLEEGLGLWRGPAYAEFADADFARPEAVRLQEVRAAAELARLDALLALGRPDAAAGEALRLVDADPYRESIWERRMRALHAAGRTVEAIRAFHEYRELLAEQTGLEPSPELAALERALVAGPAPSRPAERAGALPVPLTSLVGRDTARDELVGVLTNQRLVTLVGPAGVGKTRLAIDVAHAHREDSGSPVSFVELAAVGADGVVSALTRAVGAAEEADPITALRRVLADRRVLVVLDNCEHVLDAAAGLVEALLPFCPQLRVLATSRARLGVAGERVWVVPPLATADPDQVRGLGDLDGSPATQLFLQRAIPAPSSLVDGLASARAVTRICVAVDGLPLGIELAAARAEGLPLDRIVEALGSAGSHAPTDRAGGRHRSLEAAIDWSYGLLAPAAQRLLRRLAVFEGGWNVDAAEAVCADRDLEAAAVPGALADLVAASLVAFDPSTHRYTMLDTIHAFARTRLGDGSELAGTVDAHLRWCRRLAEGCAPRVVGRVLAGHIRTLEVEHQNLLAALRRAVTDDRHVDAATRLAVDLVAYWLMVNPGHEVAELVEAILKRAAPLTRTRVELTVGAGHLAEHLEDFRGAARLYQQAIDHARELEDQRLLGDCLVRAAFVAQPDAGLELATQAMAIAEQLGDGDLAIRATTQFGVLADRDGRYDEAVSHYEHVILMGRDDDDIAVALHSLATIHAAQGRWSKAGDQLLVIEQRAAEQGDRTWAATACVVLTQVELGAGRIEDARRAFDRATLWGRPTDEHPVDQMCFDAVDALLQTEAGELTTAAATARRLAAVEDPGEYSYACEGWLVAGEVLARAGDLTDARQCFGRILRHRAGAFPNSRANALEAMAGTLTGFDQPDVAAALAAAAARLRARHHLVTPPWLTIAVTGSKRPCADQQTAETSVTDNDDEAIALALVLALDDT